MKVEEVQRFDDITQIYRYTIFVIGEFYGVKYDAV